MHLRQQFALAALAAHLVNAMPTPVSKGEYDITTSS